MTRLPLLVGWFVLLSSLSTAGGGQAGAADSPVFLRLGDRATKVELCTEPAYAAIESGLAWLAANQREDGSWAAGGGAGKPSVPATALALLAFVGDGHTRRFGEHREVVRRGTDWILTSPVRALTPRNTALTLQVLAELRHLDGEELEPRLLPFVELLVKTVNALGTWPRKPIPKRDPRDIAWTCAALFTHPFSSDWPHVRPHGEICRWIDAQVNEDGSVPGPTEGVAPERNTALLLMARAYLAEDLEKARAMKAQLGRVMSSGVDPGGEELDLEYCHAATTALEWIGGEGTLSWYGSMRELLLTHRDAKDGTWPAFGAEPERGRVSSTALAVLTLAAPYRYRFEPAEHPFSFLYAAPSPVWDIWRSAAAEAGGRATAGRGRGDAAMDGAIAKALAWLAREQREDGSWSAEDTRHPVGCTGLAILALMGDGSTTRGGPYSKGITAGIKWLRAQQDFESGRFGPAGTGIYDHAAATQAAGEAYLYSKSPLIRGMIMKGNRYVLEARNPDGVWRYDVPPAGENDTSVTSWMIMALKYRSVTGGFNDVDERVEAACLAWLDEVTDPETGRVGYTERGSCSSRLQGVNDRYDPQATEALTAAGLFCRILLGQGVERMETLEQHADLLLKSLPEWSEDGTTCDMYYWYYGSHAMFQMGGRYWTAWSAAMRKTALESQRTEGELAGSWDPIGPWGFAGGRVYATAMMALALEADHRFKRADLGR